MPSIREVLNEIGSGVINGVRERAWDRIDEETYHERMSCIYKATQAFKEAGIEREETIRLLQKFWDLRRSEAEEFIDLEE